MNITNYLKQLDYKIVTLVFILMGISGGFSFLSSSVEFIGKLLFSFYGAAIGLLIGLGFTILLNLWKSNSKVKYRTILTFFLLGIAPMFWAYFDFEEHAISNSGLIIMLVIDFVALIFLGMLKMNDKRKLIPITLTIPIWQIISLYWFICMTWKDMNYWD